MIRPLAIVLMTSAAFCTAPALAQDAPPPADAATDETDIVVFGRGETRQVQELNAEQMTVLVPGTSALRAVERLPGVNFQAADPFGNYEWSQRISIRSFNQNQLGFTFDGVPLGDGSYGNHNGLHVSRAASSENIGRVLVSQGAGSIGTQATNNLGGTLEFFSAEPEDRMGATIVGTHGSDDMWRGFVRINFASSGGARAYVSYTRNSTDKWKGDGEQNQDNINVRALLPIGGAQIDAWYSYSMRAEQDYQDLSLGMIGRLGYDWDNFGLSQYDLALQVADIGNNRGDTGAPVSNVAAGTTYPAPIASVDDAYLDAAGIRRDHLAYVGIKAPVAGEGEMLLRGYYHNNHGQGLWGTPYVPSPTGVPISIRTTEYDIDRYGIFGHVRLPLMDIHELTVGAWWEQNDFRQARRFYGLQSRTLPGRTFQDFQTNPYFTQWEFTFDTTTLQYHVQDRIDLGALTLNIGWKGFRVDNSATPVISGGRASGDISVEDWFQPHAGFAYALGNRAELFGGFTQVTRAFASATTTGPFATTQAGFDAIRDTLLPEQSDTYELGLRFHDPVFNGVIAAYYVNFRNRLLAFSTGAGIVGNPAVLQNVGNVRALGFEVAGDVRLGRGLSLYAAYSYNDATYRDDVTDVAGAVLAATDGKTVVDSPRHILRGEAAWDNGTLFARVGASYMSRRFFTYENDQFVDGRTLVDASIGFRPAELLEIQVNATNLFDEEYVGTIGSNGFGNRGDNQTLLAGAPRQVFLTLRAQF